MRINWPAAVRSADLRQSAQAGADQLGVITFSDFSDVARPVRGGDGPEPHDSQRPAGWPVSTFGHRVLCCYVKASRRLADVEGRKVVLALTDGMDNNGQRAAADCKRGAGGQAPDLHCRPGPRRRSFGS